MDTYIWAGLAIGLVWVWVWLWEWFVAMSALKSMWDSNSEASNNVLVFTILFVALVESAAIYWLVVALQVINSVS
jgi:F0F1-type ATP synthase membrane subunit c/vacuolar-type H+-ATPase subunit K